MLKKCISLVLSLIMLSGIGSMGASALSLPWSEKEKVDICDKRNDAKGYFDLGCAESKGILEIRSNPERDWVEANVGKGAEYTLHFWPYKKLSEFVPFFKRGLFNADKTKESEMIKQKAVEEIMYSFGIRKETAEKVVERLVSDAKAQKVSLTTTSTVVNDDSSYVIKWASIGAAALGFTALGVSAFCPPVAATIGISIAAKSVFTVAATLVGGELGGVASSSKKASEHSKQALKQEIEIDNCVSAIEQILSCIKLNCWKSANTLYVKSCSNPEKYYSSVSFLKLDMKNSNNYDEYSKSFDKMRDELPDILNEYK